jgi:hypothetical protein
MGKLKRLRRILGHQGSTKGITELPSRREGTSLVGHSTSDSGRMYEDYFGQNDDDGEDDDNSGTLSDDDKECDEVEVDG